LHDAAINVYRIIGDGGLRVGWSLPPIHPYPPPLLHRRRGL